ncbi:MAG: hypothetical protein P8Y07_06170, partial [Gemmatimonadales bacterium]
MGTYTTRPGTWTDGRRRQVRRVLWWILAANVLVIIAKLAVGLRSGSIAVLGDAGQVFYRVVNLTVVDRKNNQAVIALDRFARLRPFFHDGFGGFFDLLDFEFGVFPGPAVFVQKRVHRDPSSKP